MNDQLVGHHDQKLDGNLGVNLCRRMNDRLDDLMTDANRDHHKNVMDDQNLDVNHVSRNYVRRDLSLDAMTDGSHDHRRSDLLDDRNLDDDLHDPNLVVSLCHRMNDPLVYRKTDVNLLNRNCAPRDLKMDENLDVSRDRHTNDLLVDPNLVDDLHDVLDDLRKNGMGDLKMDGTADVSLCLRMNGTDDLKTDENHVSRNCVRRDLMMVVTMDVSRGLRMNVTDDLNLDANHVNRNCAPHDPKMDANLDAMSHHVMLMVYLSKSCDPMSHDHLRYDRQMMHHRDTNRMDEMNLDEKMKIHPVIPQMMVCPKTDDRMKI
jgi:hypothetical protein